jgi:hypothetical protein
MGASARPGPLLRLLVRAGLHRHRPDPDLSALVAFPSCRCGSMVWPTAAGAGRPEPVVDDEQPRRSSRQS